MKSRVALRKCAEYKLELVEKAIRENLDALGGIDKIVKPGQRVLLKPNLVSADPPEKAATTHPVIVEAVINILKKVGAVISVGDSPGFGTPEKAAKVCGIYDVLTRTGTQLADFVTPVEVENPDGVISKRFTLAKAVSEADVIINLPKLKTHGLTYYTGGMKNLFGCIPGLRKGEYHLRMPEREDFTNMLVDLYTLVKPSLTIIDGIIGMEGEGPRSGKPKQIGVILASQDAVALDAVSCKIVGIDPLEVPTNSVAAARNAGMADINAIEVVGDTIESCAISNFEKIANVGKFIPKGLQKMLASFLLPKPIIERDKCTSCHTCVQVCPPKAISKGDLRFDYNKCIRCYCCQELCPIHAISLKKGLLLRFFSRKA